MTATYSLRLDWDNDGVFEVGEECVNDMLAFEVAREFASRTARVMQAGRAKFVMSNRTSTYTPITNAAMVPMVRVRFSMTVNAVERVLFTGYVESIMPEPQFHNRTCTLTCVDLVYRLQTSQPPMPLVVYGTADQIISSVMTAAGFPSSASSLTEKGPDVFELSSDRFEFDFSGFDPRTITSGTPFEAIEQACVAGWSRWFVDGLGQWRHYNRHHNAFNAGTDYTLSDNPASPTTTAFVMRSAFKMAASSVVNSVKVMYSPRIIGNTLEVLARAHDTTPLEVAPGESQTVSLRYRDQSGTNDTIAAMSTLNMASGVDYIATYEVAGDGLSALADVGLSATYSARSTTATFTNNNVTRSVYIRLVQVRGYAVRVQAPGEVRIESAASIAQYGKREIAITCPLLSHQRQAMRLAQFMVNQYSNPLQEVYDIEVASGQNDAAAEFVRDIELMMTLTLDHAWIGYSTDVVVAGISHRGNDKGHTVTISCEPGYQYRDDTGTPINNSFDVGDPIGSATHLMVW